MDVSRCFPSIHVFVSVPSSYAFTPEWRLSTFLNEIGVRTEDDGRDVKVAQYRVDYADLFCLRPYDGYRGPRLGSKWSGNARDRQAKNAPRWYSGSKFISELCI